MMNFGGMMDYYFQDWLLAPGFMMFGILIVVFFLAFWAWMIVDCAKRNFKSNSNEKIVWILVILFAKVVGALIYFFVVKNRK